MQIYLVGGAVRDQLLGLPIKDRDWVVVGADPETMQQQGFQAVGKDFPVFCTHKATKNTPSPHRTQNRQRLHRLCRSCRQKRYAGTRPDAPRLDHQRHGTRRTR